MNDLNVIDRFLDTFARYIDSGFGLLGGEVGWLSATLIAIDVTLAALFWAFGGADDLFARLIKKVLYVGAFAFILTNFNSLASILFRSFAGLGLQASGSGMTEAQLLQPGRLAAVGVDAGRPLLDQIGEMSGLFEVFSNIDIIVVLFCAWLVIIIAFFILAVQMFVTLIEFKLTTLAGFVLVPFAFWNKTAFLAERVLGNVVSSGIKILVLAVIVGIGSGLFAEFRVPPGTEMTIDHALAIALGSLTLLGLGIFGPGIATGLVSGAPQLGAGAAAGTALGVAGLAAAGGAVVAGGAGLAAGAAGSTLRGATSLAAGARAAYAEGGMTGVARAGASAVSGAARSTAARVFGERGAESGDGPPAWAKRMQRRQAATHGVTVAAHTLRSGDRGGPGASPTLPKED
ncbi:P-type conjugative transfer protein TrbL [Sphingomonas sp. BT-65]|uniref:P-type conjugative transfer protein TrbL n=1 Tax=Sphingomonas sp. BT-65 TaxID=2989821 RepID=UPI002236A762|nr:P-type conjugative transfer protein TrbL [Sphingomonas sp. BT-65]MCW4460816.1 P-type conjugative transfer protein TrbL [Sphingomonas sp. BT-65]